MTENTDFVDHYETEERNNRNLSLGPPGNGGVTISEQEEKEPSFFSTLLSKSKEGFERGFNLFHDNFLSVR